MLPCFSYAFAFVKIFLFANISMISRHSLAAVFVRFRTRFVFEPKAMQSYDLFLNCANFQTFFLKTFSGVSSVGAVAQGRFPFAVAKVLLFAELTKYFERKIQTNFHRFSHTADTQPFTRKTFPHPSTVPKKQCAGRTPTHTLYNIKKLIFSLFFHRAVVLIL